MNFLGHLFFSKNDPDLMYANLFGDFVKGPDLHNYTPEIQYGIRLHRKIDHYIDHHPAVQDVLHVLYSDLPRISGIAIDLFFDHLLAKNWSKYHSTPLEEFVHRFHHHSVDRSLYPKEEFWYVLDIMRKDNWILNYRYQSGLEFACRGLSRRISFPNVLHQAPEVFLEKQPIIETAFESFMQDAQLFFAEDEA